MTTDDAAALTVVLSGPVTVYESAEARETLLAALAVGKDVRVHLETSGPWDVAGVQLLLATVASARKAGRTARLTMVPGVCRDVAERSGLGDWLESATDSFA